MKRRRRKPPTYIENHWWSFPLAVTIILAAGLIIVLSLVTDS